MATLASPLARSTRDDRFFMTLALIMAAIVVMGFSVQLGMGRSTFAARPLVHIHALAFFGWVAIFVTQNALVTTGSIELHRRLGWLAAGWVVLLVVLGCWLTADMVRRGSAPFFFQPQRFLIANPVGVLTFAGLTVAAIAFRRRTEWHRRLHFAGMAILLGPAFGRLLPMPLLVPYAFEAAGAACFLVPVAGMVRDVRADGKVHPAWWWGVGAMLVALVVPTPLAMSGAGAAIYREVTDGTPGASIAGLAFASPPASGSPVTGR